MGKARIESYASQELPESNGSSESTTSSTRRGRAARVKAPLRPTSIKLTPATRGQIYEEVARRKRLELPNRTIQGVISDAIDQLIAGGK